jgi:Uma2 family endonuclease
MASYSFFRNRVGRDMADAASKLPRMSASEYLELERDVPYRHEFADGLVYAMAGATREHNLISGDIFALLMTGVKPPCVVFQSDMKVNVKTQDTEHFYYPDTHVICSDLDRHKQFNKRPVLVVEVASDRSDDYDRGEKFTTYRKLPSLREYMIVQQAKPSVELFRKRTQWKSETYGPADELVLESIQLALSVAQFYRRVIF